MATTLMLLTRPAWCRAVTERGVQSNGRAGQEIVSRVRARRSRILVVPPCREAKHSLSCDVAVASVNSTACIRTGAPNGFQASGWVEVRTRGFLGTCLRSIGVSGLGGGWLTRIFNFNCRIDSKVDTVVAKTETTNATILIVVAGFISFRIPDVANHGTVGLHYEYSSHIAKRPICRGRPTSESAFRKSSVGCCALLASGRAAKDKVRGRSPGAVPLSVRSSRLRSIPRSAPQTWWIYVTPAPLACRRLRRRSVR
jgi:hypothetical protein